jgi:4-diphosphocytidyl-2-C-methyl-D-erythritol kinase
MVVRPGGNNLEVYAPAKLNLHLEILARRSDGFHELETLMVPVSLYDLLRFRPRSDDRITLDCRWAAGLATEYGDSLGDLPHDERNIVVRALRLLQQASGTTQGAEVELIKRIPSQAGLGGASSNAAAALLAANVGWTLQWPRARLAELASQIGSDIAFFFGEGAAICRGRGERVEPLGNVPPLAVVLVRPPVGLSTPAVFKACQVPAAPRQIAPLSAAVRAGDRAGVARSLMNRLQEPAERLCPAIAELSEAFDRAGCLGHQMSGSGSSYFGICRSVSHARGVAARLRAARLGLVAWGVAGAA